MSNPCDHSPVIIIGMHRSGTSMLCKMLGDLGMFFGADQTDINHESAFFVQINRWLFEQCGATWDHPAFVRELPGNEKIYGLCKQYIANVLRSAYATDYLGTKPSGSLFAMDRPWGWKDPRNTFTLPLWLNLFPNAKILNVIRNGVDVAQSLKVREDEYLAKKAQNVDKGKILKHSALFRRKLDHRKMLGLSMSMRCLSLHGGFSLWGDYMEESQRQVQAFGQASLDIRYEQLLVSPDKTLEKICSFCNIEINTDKLAIAVSGIRSDRASAYLKNPALCSFAEEHAAGLSAYGY